VETSIALKCWPKVNSRYRLISTIDFSFRIAGHLDGGLYSPNGSRQFRPVLQLSLHKAGNREMANSEPQHRQSPTKKALRFVARALGACLLIVLTLSLWNLVIGSWQHRRNPVPGDFYTVSGLRMHIDCRGAGSPVVVMEAAASAPWSLWRKVQPQLSHTTEVCSYDRAGHGWSEPRQGPRDAQTIVRELHSLLDQAGVNRPYIMA
jgi:hypothetical protein